MRLARSSLGRRALGTLRVARDDRLRGPGRERRLARHAGLWVCVGAARRHGGVGAVPLRTLGMGRALGLDLDRRCTLGLRAVPLRPLGLLGRGVGLGPRSRRGPAGVRPRARRVRGRPELEPRDHFGWRGRRRMVPARARGAVRARLPREQHLHPQRQRDERERHEHQRDEHQRHEHQLPQPGRARSGDRRVAADLRAVAASRAQRSRGAAGADRAGDGDRHDSSGGARPT